MVGLNPTVALVHRWVQSNHELVQSLVEPNFELVELVELVEPIFEKLNWFNLNFELVHGWVQPNFEKVGFNPNMNWFIVGSNHEPIEFGFNTTLNKSNQLIYEPV